MHSDTNKKWMLVLFSVLLLWATFSWQGLTTAIHIWWGNEIFNHGFFIVPGAFYLIYLKRHTLLATPFKPTLVPLLFVIPTCFVYVVGIAGDINLFLHLATFALLPLLLWTVLGHKAAYTILFPLVFMLFSVPVGEQLIPYLQEIAADGSVFLLNATGIPLFRNGLYIEIPQGRFLVAEACSGVSFFIVSTVIGCLYAYLNFTSKSRKIAFVLISIVFPVIANILRIYGIILIAYWTDMEYAAGADHLIYGWFFFAFVIVCLLALGEWMREVTVESNSKQPASMPNAVISLQKLAPLFVVVLMFYSWYTFGLSTSSLPSHTTSALSLPTIEVQQEQVGRNNCDLAGWQPVLNKPAKQLRSSMQTQNGCATLHQALFVGEQSELISSLNRTFDPENFAQLTTGAIVYSATETRIPFTLITSSNERKVWVLRLYIIDGYWFVSNSKAKLYQTYAKLVGKPSSGVMLVIGASSEQALTAALYSTMENIPEDVKLKPFKIGML